jgi:predicted DNA binding CopG/RHH family protein
MTEQRIPKFESEEEEAKWWFDHREETSQWMEDALRDGTTLKLGDVLRKRAATGATPTVSIRIDPSDIARARIFAERRGLRYQTYLKMVLHEALEQESNRLPK